MDLCRKRALLPSVAAFVVGMALMPCPAFAGAVTDPAGDFLPSFTGTQNGDLDVLSAFATYDGSSFRIGGTVNGPITANSLYVFGLNRGVGSSNFAAIGNPGVVFDAVITLTGAGVATGRDLVAGTAFTLPAGAVTISGASFELDFAASLLPSEGLLPAQYGVNLWPRDPTVVGNGAIADFAPDNSEFVVGASVPEPMSLALLGSGVAGVVLARRRKG